MGNFAISGSQSDVLGLMFPIRKQNEEEFLWGVSRNRFLKFQNFTLHLKNLYSYIWNNGFNSISQEAIKSSFFLVKRSSKQHSRESFLKTYMEDSNLDLDVDSKIC